ncbi:GntR family transcriptional regulator [Arthrobacter sp. QXT-31]|uniref:GntR family transcriptional regulator n=1 Tax=Arthrobacter sp. QXT-31 TaxID=1357915 RepID=UPI000971766C|nr:GntR family transcriptional regulator [Arthrobacter sp. QXT-31]APX02006.1 hypothetical protein BWQ92_10045 [Arthrobacter sp. QXT-31]
MEFRLGSTTRTTLREAAIGQLRDAIGQGEIPSGTHLGEVELSQSLGISRATLREALRHLQQEGLVVQDHRGRLSVRAVTPEEISELFEVRLMMESLALHRLTKMEDRAPVLQELKIRLLMLDVPEISLAQGIEADLNFHRGLCELAGNRTLLHSWNAISGLIRITMVSAGPKNALLNMAKERHAPILDFIENGDYEGGRTFLTQHMRSAKDRLAAGTKEDLLRLSAT